MHHSSGRNLRFEQPVNPAGREIGHTDTSTVTLQRSLGEACQSLGIPLEEGARLITLDPNALRNLLRSAATQERAQQVVQAWRAEQREHMGGRFGPPLAERIAGMGELPPYMDANSVADAVLNQLTPTTHAQR